MSLRIRPMSDLHLEHEEFDLPEELPTDKDTVLVLAGDISVAYTFERSGAVKFLEECSKRFKAIVYVFGNHEHYHGVYDISHDEVRDRTKHITNLHILEKQSVEIDGVVFLGATTWTDFDKANPLTLQGAAGYMRFDFGGSIRTLPDFMKLQAEDILTEHNKSRNWLFRYAEEAKERGKKTVIIMHHGCTQESVHPKYRGMQGNGYFVSSMDREILEVQPDLIIHGHVHDAFDYMVGDTRVVVNPRGYPMERERFDNGFDPLLNIEL